MTDLGKWITIALLSLLIFPAMAQQKADSIYTFRFVAGYNELATVTGCSASGNVSGDSIVGGVVGFNCGPVTACYAAGIASFPYSLSYGNTLCLPFPSGNHG